MAFEPNPTGDLKTDINFQELARLAETAAAAADHGGLSGLGDDDHAQYVLLAGRVGGQTILQGVTIVGVAMVKAATANANLDLETADGTQLWRHQNTQGTGLYIFRDATNGQNCLGILPNTPTNTLRLDPSGIALFGAGSFGGGAGVLFLANRTTAPTSNPVGGGIQYAASGAGTWRGSGGTITTFGPA